MENDYKENIKKFNPNDFRRYSEITNTPEVKDLKEGSDFRRPEYRREVFLRFYGFHLKYKSHPGGVYYVMEYLSKKYNWDFETRLWFAFINGCTQNPLTSWVLFQHFPSFDYDINKMEEWHKKYWKNLDYDIDRRYQKGHFVEMGQNYRALIKEAGCKTQEEYFNKICYTDDPYLNFEKVWDVIYNDFFMYGRLSTFSYTEYLKIMGLNIDCNSLFMYDKSGSKSHRNGLSIVLGRDDYDVHHGNEFLHKEIKNGHNKDIMQFLEKEGELLLNDAKEKYKDKEFYKDVNYFTLESTLCCYKSWTRKNRRYANVYNDMFYDRIVKAESRNWKDIDGTDINFNDFWEARKEYLPKELRIEDNPLDPGLVPIKMNWYRKTGEVIMMENYDKVFKNSFFKKYKEKSVEWYGKPTSGKLEKEVKVKTLF